MKNITVDKPIWIGATKLGGFILNTQRVQLLKDIKSRMHEAEYVFVFSLQGAKVHDWQPFVKTYNFNNLKQRVSI